jgi:hypothetical protein
MSTDRAVLVALLLALPGALPAQEPGAQPSLAPFGSDSALKTYLAALAPPPPPPCGPTRVKRIAVSERPSADTTIGVITGSVTDARGTAVVGAQVAVAGTLYSVTTDSAGRFASRVPWRKAAPVRLRVRFIGYQPSDTTFAMSPGDSIDARFVMCEQPTMLSSVVVTGVAQEEPSITNVQTSGVDEGGIVKRHGHFLVILRRGRLFTVDIGSSPPRQVAAVNAYAVGIDPRGGWYDEMLIGGDRVAVIGYSYQRTGTELGVFRLDEAGGLSWVGTWHLRSND